MASYHPGSLALHEAGRAQRSFHNLLVALGRLIAWE